MHNKSKKLGEKKEKYTVLRLSNIYIKLDNIISRLTAVS